METEVAGAAAGHRAMTAVKAMDWIDEKMTAVYPLGVIKDTEKEDK